VVDRSARSITPEAERRRRKARFSRALLPRASNDGPRDKRAALEYHKSGAVPRREARPTPAAAAFAQRSRLSIPPRPLDCGRPGGPGPGGPSPVSKTSRARNVSAGLPGVPLPHRAIARGVPCPRSALTMEASCAVPTTCVLCTPTRARGFRTPVQLPGPTSPTRRIVACRARRFA